MFSHPKKPDSLKQNSDQKAVRGYLPGTHRRGRQLGLWVCVTQTCFSLALPEPTDAGAFPQLPASAPHSQAGQGRWQPLGPRHKDCVPSAVSQWHTLPVSSRWAHSGGSSSRGPWLREASPGVSSWLFIPHHSTPSALLLLRNLVQTMLDSHTCSLRPVQWGFFVCYIWIGVGNGNPLHYYSCLENSVDRGAWQATVCVVAKSQTWLSTNKIFKFGASTVKLGDFSEISSIA